MKDFQSQIKSLNCYAKERLVERGIDIPEGASTLQIFNRVISYLDELNTAGTANTTQT